MIHVRHTRDFLISQAPLLDVRSPGEFTGGHIPGAGNLPLLDDSNRERIGICYKQKGRDAAIALGYELVDPLREQLLESAKALTAGNRVRLYCARGGLRSNKMAEFLETNGYEVEVLRGGYKAYRNHILGFIKNFRNIIILSGYTGSGKTEILEHIARMGGQVLDLEGLANHKGSAFGALGNAPQPCSGLFHNLIYEAIRSYDPAQPLWVESESMTIGKVYIPNELWENMQVARGFEIVLPVQERISYILRNYGGFDAQSLIACVKTLGRRLGDEACREFCDLIEEGRLEPVVEGLFRYYDKAYEHGRKKRNCQEYVKLHFSRLEPERIAGFLLSGEREKSD